jgi:hypothetical protein
VCMHVYACVCVCVCVCVLCVVCVVCVCVCVCVCRVFHMVAANSTHARCSDMIPNRCLQE